MGDPSSTTGRTAVSAVLWTTAALFAAAGGETLLWTGLVRRVFWPDAAATISILTVAAAVALSRLIWGLRPLKHWPLDRLLLWCSVAAVWSGLLVPWPVSWFSGWILSFPHP